MHGGGRACISNFRTKSADFNSALKITLHLHDILKQQNESRKLWIEITFAVVSFQE